MLEQIAYLIDVFDDMVWGFPLVSLLVGTGLYLSFRLKGIQFRYLLYALKLAFFHREGKGKGDLTHFQALMTALSATIGTGNIVGVATAVATGGVGAIFWMWITACVGMATKYGEAILALKYRVTDSNGEMCGGPMYYIEKGLKLKWLALFFAVAGTFAALGTGNMVQANSVAQAVEEIFGVTPWYTGIALGIMTGLVLVGGVKWVGRVASFLVPFMALFYMSAGVLILLLNLEKIPGAFAMIFSSAFSGQAATGGFLGATMAQAIRIGVARGVFSNEAGLGSAPIVAAAAKSRQPGTQAMVSMTGTFLDTLVVCTVTGLVITISGVLGMPDDDGTLLNGAPLTVTAFSKGLPGGGYVVTIGIILFAYSTLLGWAYYGEKCFQYIFGTQLVPFYRILFTCLVVVGSGLSLKVVWGFSDIMNGLMAFPNLIALLGLSGVIVKETNSFIKSLD